MQVGIVPRDVEASKRFYCDVIGLSYDGGRPIIKGRTLHFFAGHGGTLKLLELPDELGQPSEHAASGELSDALGIRWITFDVDDLDGIATRADGSPVQMPVTELRPGLRVAIIEDPDGNAIELVERRDC